MRTTLVTAPINVAQLLDEVRAPACGAVSLFLGTVRDVNDGRAVAAIDYSAYERMAASELAKIAAEAMQHFGTERLVIEHRLGELGLGEVSVAIAVAHPRRGPSLDAMRYVIEQLKKRVPIWKREHYVDGGREWIDPTATPSVQRS